MPGYNRAEFNAQIRIFPSSRAEKAPRVQIEAGLQAAGGSGLAHEAGPDATMLSGERKEVLEAVLKVIEASLEAGAHVVEVRVEAQEDAGRLGEPGGRRGEA